jgi:hypothetical protein
MAFPAFLASSCADKRRRVDLGRPRLGGAAKARLHVASLVKLLSWL